ncbi:MAG: DUF1015 domain-containing protein [Oscillospiraceae bacterium]|nr:DUF1015 domain-containing protein [Oscillospiraceae bacterium]
MALIKAFKGLRYGENAGALKELCCPPYDIISESERQELLKKNPHNIIRLELPTSYKDGEEAQGTAAYEEAGRVIKQWVDTGILADDKEENIYVYEFSFEHEGKISAVKGFVALVKLEEFSKGIVLPHEETLSKAKTDRFNLMTATGCNFSQIYSLFSDKENKVLAVCEKATTGKPASEFTDGDNVTHRLWKISDSSVIAQIAELMSAKQVFIADGHHRYETALNYCKSVGDKANQPDNTVEFVPMMLVSMENPGLTVFPTHRIVRDLSTYDYQSVITKSGEYFDITEGLGKDAALSGLSDVYDKGKSGFVLYEKSGYTLMVLKDKGVMKAILPDAHESLRNLDVSILHSLVLERVFGIDKENMAAQKNLTYMKLAEDAIQAVDNGQANCCFLLNSTRVSEIRDVSLAGGKMPQKSTYFYPKLTTGLVMNRIFKG